MQTTCVSPPLVLACWLASLANRLKQNLVKQEAVKTLQLVTQLKIVAGNWMKCQFMTLYLTLGIFCVILLTKQQTKKRTTGENTTSLADINMKNYLNQPAFEGSCYDMHRQDSKYSFKLSSQTAQG